MRRTLSCPKRAFPSQANKSRLIASLAEAYPGITLDVTVSDEEFDSVARGFDAGVRLGQVIEQDM